MYNVKLKNDTIASNNKLVREMKVKGIDFVLQYVSIDSHNVMDTWIKQNQMHWYFLKHGSFICTYVADFDIKVKLRM